jgi:outer membrane lipopolysaccharide assembly protein LptE/RlpB
VEQHRDFTYDDTQTLAKEGEEQRLNADMRSDTIREVLRRLSVLSKARPSTDDTTPAATTEPAPDAK